VRLLLELVKMAALAALIGMLASLEVAVFTACIIGVAAFWLLLVRAT
jgi:hypothetical protein